MCEDVRPECISEIAAILARGFLRYLKSRRLQPQNGLDSGAEQSRHVTVVNDAERTDES
jgi:hypothetical protein